MNDLGQDARAGTDDAQMHQLSALKAGLFAQLAARGRLCVLVLFQLSGRNFDEFSSHRVAILPHKEHIPLVNRQNGHGPGVLAHLAHGFPAVGQYDLVAVYVNNLSFINLFTAQLLFQKHGDPP